MSELAARLAALPPDKRARLERALRARRSAVGQAIRPRDRSQPSPLSSGQQRLWFFDQLTPGAPTYNALVAMWVRGRVDAGLLERAIRRTIERHEVLRTVIRLVGDEPAQIVLDDWNFRLDRAACDGATPQEREAQAIELVRRAAREPYDLSRDLTLRVLLVEVEPRRWLLAFLEHHISFDGWSDEILFAEVGEYYDAVARGAAAPDLPPLPVQYADFAAWQRRRIRSGELAAQVDHWRQVLAGAPALLRLPLDRPYPEKQTFDGKHLPLHLDHAEGVRELRHELGVTDFMVLVAAWAATLYRWSGQSDIVLGTPLANRNRVEVEPLIGFFSNTLPLRVQVDGAQSFRQLVRRVMAVSLDAFDHQDVPFEKIVEAVSPLRDPRVNPVFQVNVRVQSRAVPGLDLPDAQVVPVHIDMGFSRFDLAVEFQMQEDAIGGYLEYNQALLDERSANSVLARLDALLGSALADPDCPIWDLSQPIGAGRRRRTVRA